MTWVVNLFAGPGTGKSTNAALVYGKLKIAGVNAELVHEFFKDLVWEERHVAQRNQLYVAGKQAHMVERLFGQVDVIVTDSPLLQAAAYTKDPQLADLMRAKTEEWDCLNYFLKRDNKHHPFNPKGRTQKTVGEAEKLDRAIRQVLLDADARFIEVPVLGEEKTAGLITDDVLNHVFRLG